VTAGRCRQRGGHGVLADAEVQRPSVGAPCHSFIAWPDTTGMKEFSFITLPSQIKEWQAAPTDGRCTSASASTHGRRADGIALQSLTRAYGGTFLTFATTCAPRCGWRALMQLPGDLRLDPRSIGWGEDGPNPPAVDTSPRCATSPAWMWSGPATRTRPHLLAHHHRAHQPARRHRPEPAKHPVLDRGNATATPPRGAARGGYILAEAAGGKPAVVLVGTGSEVQVALDARGPAPSNRSSAARVVSMHAWNGSPRRTRPTVTRVLRPASGPGSAWKPGYQRLGEDHR